MATVITVHGTNASGPEHGDRWWQKGGVLEAHLARWVEDSNGPFKLAPLIWDGANQETSRRAGAEKLLSEMEKLEAAGESYCIIGHSHGGSVAAHALRLAASQGNELPGLAQCITVATPFIEFQKSRWLFARSKLAEKAVMAAVAAYTFVFFGFIYSGGSVYRGVGPIALFGYSLLIGPLLAVYVMLRINNGKRYAIYRPDVVEFLRRTFGPRFLSLRHENDEAIGALGAVRRLKIPFFGTEFAVPALSFLSLGIVPLLAIVLTQSAAFMKLIGSTYWGVQDLAGGWMDNMGRTVTNVALGLGDPILKGLYGIGIHLPGNPLAYAVVVGAVVPPIILAALSVPVMALAVELSKIVSSGLSRLMNPLTWSQIRKSALGNDAIGELASGADHSSAWLAASSVVLPAALAEEITDLSNAVAAGAIDKFRAGMTRLLLSDEKDAKTFFFTEYISWDELIHTRYFDSERFCLLLACIVAGLPGFRESSALRDHPDRAVVGSWREELLVATIAGG